MKHIGEKIRMLVSANRDLSSKQLAQKLGISPPTLHSRYYSGRFSAEELKKVAEYFNLTVDELKKIDVSEISQLNEPPAEYNSKVVQLQNDLIECQKQLVAVQKELTVALSKLLKK